MSNWTRLALCAGIAGCGSAPPPTPPPLGEELCANPVAGTGFPGTLLRVGCEGALEPGRARWSVSQGAVTLDIAPGPDGLRGARLAAAWPSLDEPPWLGHRVERIVVLPGDRIRVVFADPAPDPARVFADPRLAGSWRAPGDGDGRDAIDRGDAGVVTRHDASIEYARSLGRSVQLVAFDQIYVVAFAGTADLARAEELAAAVGQDWIGWGAPGARRLPSLNWLEVVEQCATGVSEALGDAVSSGRAGVPPASGRRTVSYPEGDLPGRQIAERLASAGLRTGPGEAVFAALTGSQERLAVRPSAPEALRRTGSDVAAVVRVHAGPVHPCSLYGEALRSLAGWGAAGGEGGGTLLLIGEVGAYAIGRAVGDSP